MPTPQTPSLTVAADSATGFTATVSSGSASATHRLYYRRVGADVDTEHPGTVTGTGPFTAVAGLAAYAHYFVWCQAEEGGYLSVPYWTSVALSVPDRLSQAVHARFSSSPPLVAALAGGLWTGEVPEGVSYPYAWLDISQVDTLYTFVSRGEYARISVHVYGLGADATEAAMAAWKGHFDGQKLTFSSGSQTESILFVPQRYRLAGENLRHRSGSLVFRASQAYQAVLQRPR